jgi:hypothetical protein
VSVLRVARIGLGAVLILLGLVGVVFGIVDLIDPVGSKAADDGDPTGTPNTVVESLLMTGAYAGVVAAGWWMTVARRKTRQA